LTYVFDGENAELSELDKAAMGIQSEKTAPVDGDEKA
jgi:hypothetical protein